MSRHDDGVGGGVYDVASQTDDGDGVEGAAVVGEGIGSGVIVGEFDVGAAVGEGVHEKPLICTPFSSTRAPMSWHEMPMSEYTLAMAAATAW